MLPMSKLFSDNLVFGTRSSDAKKNKKTTKPPGKFISYEISLDPPPLHGKFNSQLSCVDKM